VERLMPPLFGRALLCPVALACQHLAVPTESICGTR
jgi:hypothetical protein